MRVPVRIISPRMNGRRIEIIVRLRYTYFDFVCIIQSVSFSRNGCAVRVETAGYNRREGV